MDRRDDAIMRIWLAREYSLWVCWRRPCAIVARLTEGPELTRLHVRHSSWIDNVSHCSRCGQMINWVATTGAPDE